jgi:hypothetical protein
MKKVFVCDGTSLHLDKRRYYKTFLATIRPDKLERLPLTRIYNLALYLRVRHGGAHPIRVEMHLDSQQGLGEEENVYQ